MQEICRRLKPTELEDLAVLTLYLVGSLDGGWGRLSSPPRGEKKVADIVPEMKDILSNTYGILVIRNRLCSCAKTRRIQAWRSEMMRGHWAKKAQRKWLGRGES